MSKSVIKLFLYRKEEKKFLLDGNPNCNFFILVAWLLSLISFRNSLKSSYALHKSQDTNIKINNIKKFGYFFFFFFEKPKFE